MVNWAAQKRVPEEAPASLKKTRLTPERVSYILDHPELSNESLSERTDGLSIPLIRLIKKAEDEGLRGKQGER